MGADDENKALQMDQVDLGVPVASAKEAESKRTLWRSNHSMLSDGS